MIIMLGPTNEAGVVSVSMIVEPAKNALGLLFLNLEIKKTSDHLPKWHNALLYTLKSFRFQGSPCPKIQVRDKQKRERTAALKLVLVIKLGRGV